MKRPSFPAANGYAFELDLEISSALNFSAGDLSTLIADGLFALDAGGKLFPGLTTPPAGSRLISVKMGAVGYTRRHTGPREARYRRLLNEHGRQPSKSARDLEDRLDTATDRLSDANLTQSMLIARLAGLADKCRQRGALTDADRTIAEALLGAADKMVAAVDHNVRPVL